MNPLAHGNLELTVHNLSRIKVINALMVLADRMPFGNITVKDICQEAGVSRQTFYRHFSGKHEAVTWFWYELAKRYMAPLGHTMGWYESLVYLFSEAAPYMAFFSKAAEKNSIDSVFAFARRARTESLQVLLEGILGGPLTDSLRFQVEFFSEAEAAMVARAAASGALADVEAFARNLDACVPPRLHELVDGAVASEEPDSAPA